MSLIKPEDLLLKRVKLEDLPEDHKNNLLELCKRINEFFKGYSWARMRCFDACKGIKYPDL